MEGMTIESTRTDFDRKLIMGRDGIKFSPSMIKEKYIQKLLIYTMSNAHTLSYFIVLF